MKKLFAVFLSLQMILSPVVFANGIQVDGTEELSSSYLGDDQAEKDRKGGYDFYTKQILGMGISAVGTGIVSKCLTGLKVPSIATFMGGSLVHIGSEVLGGKLETQAHEKRLKDIKIVEEKLARGGGELQKEALLQRKKTEEQTRDFLKKRILWLTAVGVIYAASSGLSILENSTALATSSSTMVSSCAATAGVLASSCTAGYAACYPGYYAGCVGVSTSALSSGIATGNSTGFGISTATCTGSALFSAPCAAVVSAYHGIAYGGCTQAPSTSAFSWTSLIGLAYGFGASKTGGSGAISQYGGLVMGLLPVVVKGVDVIVSTTFSYPIQRSITMGAFAGLTGVVVSGLVVRKNIAEKNIEKLNRVLASFENGTKTDKGIEEGSSGLPGSEEKAPITPKDMKALSDGNIAKNCISKTGNNFDVSEKACGNSVKLTNYKFDFKGANVPTLTAASNLASDLANSVASGDFASADILAGQLGSMAAAVKAVNEKLQKDHNESEVKAGKKAVDFNKGIATQVAQLEGDIKNALGSNSDLASAMNGLSSQEASSSTKDETPVVTSAKTPEVAIPNANFNFSEDSTSTEELPSAKTASLSESLEEYESTEQDISKKSDVSIFKQVSNRYLLNYTRIFDKKKTLEESSK